MHRRPIKQHTHDHDRINCNIVVTTLNLLQRLWPALIRDQENAEKVVVFDNVYNLTTHLTAWPLCARHLCDSRLNL